MANLMLQKGLRLSLRPRWLELVEEAVDSSFREGQRTSGGERCQMKESQPSLIVFLLRQWMKEYAYSPISYSFSKNYHKICILTHTCLRKRTWVSNHSTSSSIVLRTSGKWSFIQKKKIKWTSVRKSSPHSRVLVCSLLSSTLKPNLWWQVTQDVFCTPATQPRVAEVLFWVSLTGTQALCLGGPLGIRGCAHEMENVEATPEGHDETPLLPLCPWGTGLSPRSGQWFWGQDQGVSW